MWWTLPGDWPAPREPLHSEREVPELHVTGAEGMGQRRVIGGIVVLEGNEAECHGQTTVSNRVGDLGVRGSRARL